MPDVELTRLEARNPVACLGNLAIDGEHYCHTLELPWLRNRPRHSCIPIGVYSCQLVQSPRFGVTYEVLGVPGRSEILFHWGNTVEDTAGCILLGEHIGKIEGQPAVLSSKDAFDGFMEKMAGIDTFQLTVQEVL